MEKYKEQLLWEKGISWIAQLQVFKVTISFRNNDPFMSLEVSEENWLVKSSLGKKKKVQSME